MSTSGVGADVGAKSIQLTPEYVERLDKLIFEHEDFGLRTGFLREYIMDGSFRWVFEGKLNGAVLKEWEKAEITKYNRCFKCRERQSDSAPKITYRSPYCPSCLAAVISVEKGYDKEEEEFKKQRHAIELQVFEEMNAWRKPDENTEFVSEKDRLKALVPKTWGEATQKLIDAKKLEVKQKIKRVKEKEKLENKKNAELCKRKLPEGTGMKKYVK